LDPSDPDIKRLMYPIFEKSINEPLKPMAIVNSSGEHLRSINYDSQIEKSPDSTGLFLEVDGVRQKLFFRNNHFKIDTEDLVKHASLLVNLVKHASLLVNEEIQFSSKELIEVLQSEPWKFSPNVAIRPIAQDYILPTVAYVAGPGEISYFAQLPELYEFFHVNMPVIYPRASFTVLESKVERIMDKNSLELKDLSENHDKIFSQLSKDIASAKLGNLLETSKSGINGIFEGLAVGLYEFDPNLKNIVESTKNKIDHQINILEERAYKIQRDRDNILREQIKRACMNIFPDGNPQERVFNIVQYLVLYGLQFIDDVIAAIEKVEG